MASVPIFPKYLTLTSSYDIFAINLANLILGFVYGPSTGTTPALESGRVSLTD